MNEKRLMFPSVPKTNHENIIVTHQGGKVVTYSAPQSFMAPKIGEMQEIHRTTNDYHHDTPSSPYLQSLHDRIIPMEQIGRRNTTELDVNRTLAPLHLERLQMPADGACMFRAISHQLFGTGTKHQEVRENAVRQIITRKEEFLPFIQGELGENITIGQYCKKMLKSDNWGGNIELQGIAHFYQKKIIIYANGRPPLELGDEYNDVLRLWFSHGNHYDCVYPKRQLELMGDCQSIITDIIGMLFQDDWTPSLTSKPYKNYDLIYWKQEKDEQEKRDIEMAHHLERNPTPTKLHPVPNDNYYVDNEDLSIALARKLQEEEDSKYSLTKSANDVQTDNYHNPRTPPPTKSKQSNHHSKESRNPKTIISNIFHRHKHH